MTRATMSPLVLAALLSLATRARAAEADAAPADPSVRQEPPQLAVALDLGVPEGLAASLLYRPWAPLRLRAGPAWNYLSWAVQGGVDLVAPVAWPATPVLSLDAGHGFEGDLSRFASASSGLSPVLRRVSYDWAAVLLGVELGAPRGLVFSVRAGLGYFWMDARGRADVASSSSQNVSYHVADPKLRGTIPCVKLGLHHAFL